MPDFQTIAQMMIADWASVTKEYKVLPQPAAGAGFAPVTVPGDQIWMLDSAFCQLVTSAAVSNRDPHLLIGTPDFVFSRLPNSATVAASLTTRHSWLRGCSPRSGIVGTLNAADLPDMILFGGMQITITALTLDAADQFSLGLISYMRFDRPPFGGIVEA